MLSTAAVTASMPRRFMALSLSNQNSVTDSVGLKRPGSAYNQPSLVCLSLAPKSPPRLRINPKAASACAGRARTAT